MLAAALHLDIGLWDRSDLQMRLLGLFLWFCSKAGSLGSVCLEAPGPCQGSWLLAADTGPGGAVFPPGGILGPILPEISLEREPQLQQQRAERRFQESLRIGPAEHLPVQSP